MPGFTHRFQVSESSSPVPTAEFSSSKGPAEEGMEADDLLCSRNAWPQKALARDSGTLGVPVGGRVRKLRAAEARLGPIPEDS